MMSKMPSTWDIWYDPVHGLLQAPIPDQDHGMWVLTEDVLALVEENEALTRRVAELESANQKSSSETES